MEFKGKYSFLSTMYGSSFEGREAKPLFYLRKDEIIRLADPKLRDFLTENLPEQLPFTNVESAFQLLRASNVQDFLSLVNVKSGYESKKIAKTIKVRKGWSAHRDSIMRFLTMRKFVQNLELAEKLLRVTEPIKNEVAYTEYYWGVHDGRGQNMLGTILRDARKSILEKKIENFKTNRLLQCNTKYQRDDLIKKFCDVYNVSADVFTTSSNEKNVKAGKSVTFKNNEYHGLRAFVDELQEKKEFYIVDCETTGVAVRYCDIVELSAIRVDNNFNIIGEFDTFINPGYTLPLEIVEFNEKNGTGINDEVLSAAPKPKEAYAKFKEFIGDSSLISGQNVQFDIRFIDKLANKAAKEAFAPEYVVDTLKMAKEQLPGSHTLSVLYKQIPNAPEITFHKSIDDVKATLEVLKWLIPRYLNEYSLDGSNNLVKEELQAPSLEDYAK